MSLRDTFLISWKNDIAEYTLAADIAPEDAYPLTNCQNQIANEFTVWDMTSETELVITWSGATARSATCFAIHNHDLPDGTTVLLELFPDETQGGTELLDLEAEDVMHNVPFGSIIAGVDPIEGNFEDEGQMKTHFSLWFDTVTYKSGRLTITNASGFTNDQLKIDKLWLGFAYAAEYGQEYGWQSTLLDDSIHQRKPGGGMETVPGVVRRTLSLEFKMMQNSERHVIRHIFDRAKKGGDVLVTLDPNDVKSQNYETTSIYRRMNDTSFTATFFNSNDLGLALEEN